jgi:DNA-directed RNA polymerase subunit beta
VTHIEALTNRGTAPWPILIPRRKRIRKDFGKRPSILDVPFLLATQMDSYRNFLQIRAAPQTSAATSACTRRFDQCFPSPATRATRLEYVSYRLGEPGFDVKECQLRGLTYAAPLRVLVRLVIYDKDAEAGSPRSRTSRSRKSTWANCP